VHHLNGNYLKDFIKYLKYKAISRVKNKDTILTGLDDGLWAYNPEIAYTSSAVVENIEQLPSKANNQEQIIYDGTHAIAKP